MRRDKEYARQAFQKRENNNQSIMDCMNGFYEWILEFLRSYRWWTPNGVCIFQFPDGPCLFFLPKCRRFLAEKFDWARKVHVVTKEGFILLMWNCFWPNSFFETLTVCPMLSICFHTNHILSSLKDVRKSPRW